MNPQQTADDIFNRHKWLYKDLKPMLVKFIAKRFRFPFKKINKHPDAILAAYLNSHLKKVFDDEYRNFFQITKAGVSAIANFDAHIVKPFDETNAASHFHLNFSDAMYRKLYIIHKDVYENEAYEAKFMKLNKKTMKSLIFYSLVPVSWAKKWNDNDTFSFILEYGHFLLNSKLVNSAEDLVNLLRPYKGDVLNMFTYDAYKSKFFVLPADSKSKETINVMQALEKSKDKELNKRSVRFHLRLINNGINEMFDQLVDTIINPLLDFNGKEVNHIDAEFKLILMKNLLGENSLYKMHQKSKNWHELTVDISQVYNSYTKNKLKWKPLCKDYKTSNNIQVLHLKTATDLLEEGSSQKDKNGIPGLNHCVGSYVTRCEKGQSHIVSIRRTLEDGKYERLSTAELKFNDSNVEVVQHYGYRNTIPNREDRIALTEFMNEYKKGSLKLDDEYSKERNLTPIEETEKKKEKFEALYILWKPLLAKKYKNMTLEELMKDIQLQYGTYQTSKPVTYFKWSDIADFFRNVFFMEQKTA